MAYATLIITFSILVGILYLFNPSWVQIVNKNTGKTSISWKLLLSYSATFALVLAIAALIIVSNHRIELKQQEYAVQFPDHTNIDHYIN